MNMEGGTKMKGTKGRGEAPGGVLRGTPSHPSLIYTAHRMVTPLGLKAVLSESTVFAVTARDQQLPDSGHDIRMRRSAGGCAARS